MTKLSYSTRILVRALEGTLIGEDLWLEVSCLSSSISLKYRAEQKKDWGDKIYTNVNKFFPLISNKPSCHQEHPGVSDGPDGSDGTSYPLTENHTWQVALHTSLVAAIIPCLLFLRRVALYITLTTPASGLLYFVSRMWWRIRTITTTRMLHSSQGSNYIVAVNPTPSTVYTFHRPSPTFYLSHIALYRMPHSPIHV
jgi:hypothetical protein